MASTFPGTLDSFATDRADATAMATNHAGDHNNYADAISKIETKVGTGASTPVANSLLAGTGSGVSAWGTSFNLGAGQNFNAYVSTTGQLVDIMDGTVAAPDTTTDPVFKVARTIEIAEASVGGDGADECCAILGQSLGTTACEVQPIGIMGFAKTTSTAGYPGNDACGLYGVGRIVTGGTGTGIGAFIMGSRDSDSGTVCGLEVKANNLGSAEVYSPGGFSQTTGIFLGATGTASSGVGLAVVANTMQWDVGIGFLTGSTITSSLRDDSSATTSIDINGTHTYGIDLQGATLSTAAIRLPNAVYISARNQSNTVDLNMLGTNTSNEIILGASGLTVVFAAGLTVRSGEATNFSFGTTTGTKIGTATTQKLAFYNSTPIIQPANTTDLKDTLVNLGLLASGGATPLDLDSGAFTGASIAVGTTPATTGAVRIPNNSPIYARNAANSADIAMISLSSTNRVIIAPEFGSTQIGTNAIFTFAEGANIAAGTTTGMKIGTGTTQKLGFWNSTPVVQGSVSGSRGANAALASLLTLLASYGLIVDSSSA